MTAADLVKAVGHDVEQTASVWRELGLDPLVDVWWPDVLTLALQHGLEGIVLDVLETLGWCDRIPLLILDDLTERSATSRSRYEGMWQALASATKSRPHLLSDAVFFGGSVLQLMYPKPEYRETTAVTAMASGTVVDTVAPVLGELGWQQEVRHTGPTFGFPLGSGHGTVRLEFLLSGPDALDAFTDGGASGWLEGSSPFELNGVLCRTMSDDLHLIKLLILLHRDAASWTHAAYDDDARLIKIIDIEVLLQTHDVDAAVVWARARELRREGEVALGLWTVAALRGGLPEPLRSLHPVVSAVGSVANQFAAPDGSIGSWPVPLRERAFRPDRSEIAISVGSASGFRRLKWGDYRSRDLEGHAEAVGEIAARARVLVDAL